MRGGGGRKQRSSPVAKTVLRPEEAAPALGKKNSIGAQKDELR